MARFCWWYLRRRGLVYHLNDPEAPWNQSPQGWRPLFSIRYGHVPVYRVDKKLQKR